MQELLLKWSMTKTTSDIEIKGKVYKAELGVNEDGWFIKLSDKKESGYDDHIGTYYYQASNTTRSKYERRKNRFAAKNLAGRND